MFYALIASSARSILLTFPQRKAFDLLINDIDCLTYSESHPGDALPLVFLVVGA